MIAPREGGRILVEQLMLHGADLAFSVPGESFLSVLDAFYEHREKFKLVTCRHEAGASNMAEAYGKLTGKPGICLVTRMPGAAQAAIGVHTAFQDSTPMILFIGDVGSDFRHREAFQEVDFAAMFAPAAKWAARIDSVERIPEYIARAWNVATSGRRGPVVLALPEDMLSQSATVADARPVKAPEAHPGTGDMNRLREMLAAARRPLAIVGGSGWSRQACEDFAKFAHANKLPVGADFRYQDLFDNRDPNYVGDVGIGINPVLANRVRMADLLLVVGARLGEMTTSGYTLLSSPVPKQKLVHVYPDAAELGRVYQPELAIVSDAGPFALAASAMAPLDSSAWASETSGARADYEAWIAKKEMPGRLQMWSVVEHLDKVMPEDTIYTNGAGNFSVWLHRFHRYTGFRTQLAPTSGAMGYGVPAAIGAKIAEPKRAVVCFSGDGDFLMTGQELATAVQYDAAVIILVINNGMYGTIRMHQEKHYPGRVVGTDLVNPHFAAFARAFGAVGEIVEETAQFAPALERAIASGKPAVIELRIDPQAITPNATLDGLRAAAAKKT
ncbi:thiamine pyrophosphate-binding protein [Usitatibacter palustris]|uniref:Acetolactate synthase isozyme 2 large subunit n=1 Tax=Usitatibacter palustris TaxID=2732487 RepID=A0A6M4HDD6_9PROT|nr:thiamine pyrophosphate-binding protein [Usitatibacter palustris]QJR15997.1 Acetolactate synthase isozyme 2 large subunit [Usitatibacter palustris]